MRLIRGSLLGLVCLVAAGGLGQSPKPRPEAKLRRVGEESRPVLQVPASCIADLRFGKCYQDPKDGRTHCPDTTFVHKCVAVTAAKPRT